MRPTVQYFTTFREILAPEKQEIQRGKQMDCRERGRQGEKVHGKVMSGKLFGKLQLPSHTHVLSATCR